MMLRRTFHISMLLFLILMMTGNGQNCRATQLPDPNDGSFYIAAITNIGVDGLLDEWTSYLPVRLDREEFAKYRYQDWRGPADCSARFWWAWNEAGIYLAVETVDDSIAFPFSGYQSWANDCIQFAFDIDDDNSQNEYRQDDYEFVVTWDDSGAIVYEYDQSEGAGVVRQPFPAAMMQLGDTLRYEVMIPWHHLRINLPLAGRHIGVSLVVFDNDGAHYRGWLEWTAGIAMKKFTLPFANLLLFDPEHSSIQALPAQSFLAIQDTLEFWLYSRAARRGINLRMVQNDEILFNKQISVSRKTWKKIQIPAAMLKAGPLQLQVAHQKNVFKYDLAIWSKAHIVDQIAYLATQARVLKDLKNVDPSANYLIQYWIDGLNHQLNSAITGFDYYEVMNQAQKRIDQIPNLYMNKPVFFDREFRLVEHAYRSARLETVNHYVVALPEGFDSAQYYPLYVYLHNENESPEAAARRMAPVLSQWENPLIGVFPGEFYGAELSHLSLIELIESIDDVLQRYRIDPSRIHLSGNGLGAEAAVLLAHHYPDRFASATLLFPRFSSKLSVSNLIFTPIWVVDRLSHWSATETTLQILREGGAELETMTLADTSLAKIESPFGDRYLDWLISQRKDLSPTQLTLRVNRFGPSAAYWIAIRSQFDYSIPSTIEARIDSNQLFINCDNVTAFQILVDRLPQMSAWPLRITINASETILIQKQQLSAIFALVNRHWRPLSPTELPLQKSAIVRGPLSNIFGRPIKIVYSTQHSDPAFNQLSYDIALRSVQIDQRHHLKQLVLPDTLAVKQKLNTNLIIFGNEAANNYLKALASKLPIQVASQGLKFGNSNCYAPGAASIYIYPNPTNPNYLILVAHAPDLEALKNIATVWDLSYFNNIYGYDYLIVENGVERYRYEHWIDYGHFDRNWGVAWYQPNWSDKPKHWLANLSLGLDANQLSFNNNWRGGGKASFTWKINTTSELNYQRRFYKWTNRLVCSFGQISVQEQRHWKAPEKSSDILDYDTTIRFTVDRLIDPYLGMSLNTQFKAGYDPKTEELVSRFANPLQLTQSVGLAYNLMKRQNMQITSRLGGSAKELIASDRRLRKRWTGDQSRGMKIDGGVEWLTEMKTEIKPGVQYNARLKLFQAFVSSISKDKDPHQNWHYTDVHWEQNFSIKISQFIAVNVLTKFIYDRDTSKAGQFLENASLGISYKAHGLTF
ncbi:MAG: DUF3078 domain-containing protein [candidate division KSB1 bacterium]|nr:DUF3078 domain-containing protein [candidate division KSB1 bacterium]MDZ7335968.1 DUF3078 domain-containing protein [candidate division KSB1 bacterium]